MKTINQFVKVTIEHIDNTDGINNQNIRVAGGACGGGDWIFEMGFDIGEAVESVAGIWKSLCLAYAIRTVYESENHVWGDSIHSYDEVDEQLYNAAKKTIAKYERNKNGRCKE